MNRTKVVLLLLGFSIVLILGTFVLQDVTTNTKLINIEDAKRYNIDVSTETSFFMLSSDYIQHDPILVEGDSDLVSQGWPGSGTPENPYLISGFTISQRGFNSISIYHTTLHIRIEKCYLSGTLDADFGILLTDSENITITNCEFYANNVHVFVNYSRNCIVKSNSMFFTRYAAIDVQASPSTIVCNNTMEATMGIWISRRADYCEVFNNTIKWNSISSDNGLIIGAPGGPSRYCQIYDNVFIGQGIWITGDFGGWMHNITGNTINGKPYLCLQNVSNRILQGEDYGAIILINCTDVTVKGGNFYQTGIAIMLGWCKNCVIENCNTYDTRSEGMFLQHCSDCTIKGCHIEDTTFNTPGISTQYQLRLSVYNNSIINVGGSDAVHSAGMYMWRPTDCSVWNNTITASGGPGLQLFISSNSRYENNTIERTRDTGIFCWAATDSTTVIFGNTFVDNAKSAIDIRHSIGVQVSRNAITSLFSANGIFFENSQDCLLSENTFHLGTAIEISDAGCIGNLIYHNNFIDSTVFDILPANNMWYHPTLLEGNFWSEYLGFDDGSGTDKHAIAGDGIGDTLIPWPDIGYDFYPYTHESGWLDTQPPVTEANLEGLLGLEGWYLSEVYVQLTAIDEESGIDEIYYSFDNQNWFTYSTQILTSSEGTTIIFYYSIDNMGNIEITKSITIAIDKTSPTSELMLSGIYVSESGTIYITTSSEFSIDAYDSESGIGSTYYKINGGELIEYSNSFSIQGAPGLYTVSFYSIDIAGNIESTKTLTVELVSLSIQSSMTEGDQNEISFFDVIFVKDHSSGGYKIVSTNPGQFFLIIEVTNTLPINLNELIIGVKLPIYYNPYEVPFIFNGGPPFTLGCHIYLNGLDITSLIASYQDPTIDQLYYFVINDIAPGGIVKLSVHLAYGLKGEIYESLESFNLRSYQFDISISGTSQDISTNQANYVTLIAHQKKTTAIAGFVTDLNGQPIDGATVELLDSFGTVIMTTLTNEDGFYYFVDLNPGIYVVRVQYNTNIYTKDTIVYKDELAEILFIVE